MCSQTHVYTPHTHTLTHARVEMHTLESLECAFFSIAGHLDESNDSEMHSVVGVRNSGALHSACYTFMTFSENGPYSEKGQFFKFFNNIS